jgi:hypothetical protein
MFLRPSLMALALVVSGSAWSQSPPAPAQQGPVSLSAYADKNGFIDVQALTCAQLADTFQEDADMLMTWYSGWYNGLAKKHFFHMTRGVELEHQVIVYCKANRGKKVIEAIATIFKDERIKKGIKMN